jgi:hypothetical protein
VHWWRDVRERALRRMEKSSYGYDLKIWLWMPSGLGNFKRHQKRYLICLIVRIWSQLFLVKSHFPELVP